MTRLNKIGTRTLTIWQRHADLAAVAFTTLTHTLRPSTWPRTTRDVFARQVLFTAIEAVGFVCLIAVMVGISIVVQVQLWLSKVGQSELLGPLLVAVVIREAAPLLVNFVVIGRSGTAIASELASMRVAGEVRVLDAQGLDPFTYLVVPRVLSVAVAVFCLTIIFIVVSFAAGFLSGVLLGAQTGGPGVFTESVFAAIRPRDIVNLLAKTVLPGLLTGAICCTEGLSVRGSITEVPQATTRGLVRSVAALFVISALVSVLTYL